MGVESSVARLAREYERCRYEAALTKLERDFEKNYEAVKKRHIGMNIPNGQSIQAAHGRPLWLLRHMREKLQEFNDATTTTDHSEIESEGKL